MVKYRDTNFGGVNMYSRKFTSSDEAITYLKERGRLEFFGREGLQFEYCVYNFHLPDGRKYHVDVWDDGKVTAKEFNVRQYF